MNLKHSIFNLSIIAVAKQSGSPPKNEIEHVEMKTACNQIFKNNERMTWETAALGKYEILKICVYISYSSFHFICFTEACIVDWN
jgi:hypothetical protein